MPYYLGLALLLTIFSVFRFALGVEWTLALGAGITWGIFAGILFYLFKNHKEAMMRSRNGLDPIAGIAVGLTVLTSALIYPSGLAVKTIFVLRIIFFGLGMAGYALGILHTVINKVEDKEEKRNKGIV